MKIGGVVGNVVNNAVNETKGAAGAIAGGTNSSKDYFDPRKRLASARGILGSSPDSKMEGVLGSILDKVRAKGLSGDALPQLADMRQLSQLGDKGVISAPQVGSSPWLQMAMKKQTADQARGLDVGMQNQAQALAAGRAMNPRALMSGTNENMAAGGLLDNMKMRQSMALQNAMGNAGVQMQGAGKETDLNQFNAGLKNQAAQANISNSVQDLINQNQNNAYKYGEAMKMKAANATSQGIANSGSGGKK